MGKPTLFIAAGHGGTDKGNTTTRFCEADELIVIVDHMTKWLDNYGISSGVGGYVQIDHTHALQGEIGAINAWKPDGGDLAIDVHLDYRNGSSGALVIVDESEIGMKWSKLFLDRWCNRSGIKNNGIHDSKVWATTQRGWTDMGFCRPRWPGVILELGCLNSNHDMSIVKNDLMRYVAAQFMWEAWQHVS